MKQITSGWNIVRAIRLAFGLMAVWQAVLLNEWMLGITGALVAGLAIVNKGCCGTAGCTVSAPSKNAKQPVQDINYEEVS